MMNILYNGRTIYKNLTYEECAEVLDELATIHYDTNDYNPENIELEMIENG
jgi:hypothetical protein